RSLLKSIATDRDSREHAGVLKCTVMLITIQIIRAGIIRHIEIGPAIVIVVTPLHSQTVIAVGIINPGFPRYFFESAIAAIVKQQIALALHAPRTALNSDSLEAASLLITPKSWQVIDVEVHVARDE